MISLFRHSSVSGRLLLVLLPMVLALVASTAWLAMLGSEKIADRNATRYGQDLAESQVSVIAMPVRGMKLAVDNLALALRAYAASGGADRRFVADLVSGPLEAQADFVTALWFYAAPDAFGRDSENVGRDISVADARTGRMVSYYTRADGKPGFAATAANFEQENYWRLPRSTGQSYLTTPYLHPVAGRDRLMSTFAVPVIVDDKFIGVVGADLDVLKAGNFLESLRPAGGHLLAINGLGLWIGNPYGPFAGKKVEIGDDWRSEMPAWEFDAIASNRAYVADKTGPKGERVRRVAVPLPFFEGERSRMLLADFPLDTLLAPYKDVRLAILLGGLLAAVAIAVAVFITVPILIGNPLQTLRRSIENLNAGQLNEPVMATERADDIGAIARALNAFRHTLIDQRRLEREKGELQNQLMQQQKMDAIGQLAGGIAHDFNNLLGVILGYLAFISTDAPNGSSTRKYAEQATRAGNRAKDMIRQLLSFARPSVGQRVVVAADAVMQETSMLLRGMLPSSIALDTQVSQALPTIRVDQTQMIQVLMNLCINASDAFGGRGGSVAVRAGLAPHGAWDRLSADWPSFAALAPAAAAGPFVTFEVFDNAGGIAADSLSHLFEPFYTTKGPGKGTGMGLAIVYGVLQAHGGGLEVRSKKGVGTLFRLSLPFIPGRPTEVAASEPLRPMTSSRRVLIVDDEQDMADMLEEGLSRLGHEVAVCEDALEALAVFDDNPDAFDVVLTDQTMPGMAGVELIRRLKQRRPNLPCLLYTGYSDGRDDASLRASGADALLFKPVLPAAVDAYIAEAMGATTAPRLA